ncbi:flagellar hook-length control protein FliK [Thioclava electrotropha]|uniref:Flagellar hook-length control protein FliK n=1 Tax=Thioclava electrotropha TaxID=1549850 RepID=A0ABX6YQH1_9RHOB|nr:flagellar hook-length control protein FliK [Thioclava electrotropha]QPZ89807.1 flagellar hook-length control protein FliK [Thioclava electrotropha]
MDAIAATLLKTTASGAGAGRKSSSEATGFGSLLQGVQPDAGSAAKAGASAVAASPKGATAAVLAGNPALQAELAGKLQKVRDGALAELAQGKPIGAVLKELGSSLATVLAEFDAAHGTKLQEALAQALEAMELQAGGAEAKPASDHARDKSDTIDEVFASLLVSLGLQAKPPEPASPQKGGAQTPSVAGLTPAHSVGDLSSPMVQPQPEVPQTQTQVITSVPQGLAGAVPAPLAPEVPQNDMDPRVRAVLEAAANGAGKTGKTEAQAAVLSAAPGKGDPKPAQPFAEAARAGALPDAAVARLTQHDASHTARSEAPAQPGQTAQPSPRFAVFVATQLRRADLQEGRTRVALTPRGLGDIEIDVERDKHGQVNVVVRAESPAVLSALRGDRETLAAILAGQGLQMDSGALDFEQFGGHGEGEEERSSGQGASIDEDVPVLGADWQPTIDDGQLDIRT